MEAEEQADQAQDRGLGAAAGRIALPIRGKLLAAFLVVVGLMIALALMGISELRNANDRADELVDDQVRISTLTAIERSLHGVRLAGADLLAKAGDDAQNRQLAQKLSDEVFLFRAAAVQTGNPGRTTYVLNPDVEQAFFAADRQVQAAASKLRRTYLSGDLAAARALYETEFSDAIRAANRIVLRISFDFREGMAARGRENAAAFARARTLVLAASGLAVLLALVLGYAISASITRPLDLIRQALGRLSGGGFDARVRVANRDELGELAGHVNRTSARLGDLYDEIEAQKEELSRWNLNLEAKVEAQVAEIDRAGRLRRFLPAQVAEMVLGAQDEAEVLRTRRAEITVLFADLRGFTAFANAAAPDQVIAALNRFHGTCGPLIEASGGTLERFLGDGLMVLFGAPMPMEDAAQRAVDLAREMRDAVGAAMAEFKAGTEERGLGIGIGIGTGAATLGQIGFEARRDYSAIGPAPNLAARLCDMAQDGQILISHSTAWQVEAQMTPAGPFDLKGVGQGIAAFEL